MIYNEIQEKKDGLQLRQHFHLKIKIRGSFPHANTSESTEKEVLSVQEKKMSGSSSHNRKH